jgi:general stress protein 26
MKEMPTIDAGPSGLRGKEQFVKLAREVIGESQIGILTTVDDHGRPAVRWMSTLSFDEFPTFYALTGPESRKILQIERHADVNWMFFKENLSFVLNLVGKARILTDTPTLKRVWKQVEDKSHAYFLKHYAKGPGFVVIETTVTAIECTSPQDGMRVDLAPSDLAIGT